MFRLNTSRIVSICLLLLALVLSTIVTIPTEPPIGPQHSRAEDPPKTSMAEFVSVSRYSSQNYPRRAGLKVSTLLPVSSLGKLPKDQLELDVFLDRSLRGDFEVFDAEMRRATSNSKAPQPYFSSETLKDTDARLLFLALEPDDYFLDFKLRARTDDVGEGRVQECLKDFSTGKAGIRVAPRQR